MGCVNENALLLDASNTTSVPRIVSDPLLALLQHSAWSISDTLHRFVLSHESQLSKAVLYTAPAKCLLTPGAQRASHNSCVGKASRRRTQCADPFSRRRWHLLRLLETSQLAGVRWVGGWMACTASSNQGPACNAAF